jgi:nucleoside-diphosphate-sugar epimerase
MSIEEPVLVTGGTGFIGRRLIDRLLEMKLRVRSFALPGEPVPEAWGDRVEVLRGDITVAEDVDAAMTGIATAFHLAAVVGLGSYEHHWSITVEGSRHLYEAALANRSKVVLASSIVVYGDQIQSRRCHDGLEHGHHQGPYSRAKMAQEKLGLAVREDRGLRLVVVRPANVYGAGSGPWVQMPLALLQANRLPIVGDGSGDAGLVHVGNLVEAFLLAAAEAKAEGRIYTACDELGVSWGRYFNDLAAMVGKSPVPEVPLAPLVAAAREHEDLDELIAMEGFPTLPLEILNLVGHSNRFDSTKLREELGWQPTVSYDDALAEIRAGLATGA